ncbi:MAG: SDR family oxidoreductase [Nitrospira sp.]|nr:SDR family oxidoreductase [Nitrospira sp.]
MGTYRRFRLDGRIAIITGAAGLLGSEHAAALLESGATVVLTDVREAALAETAGRLRAEYGGMRIFTAIMDVSNPRSVHAASEEILARWQRVDMLVNNAAIDPKVTHNTLVETSRFENFPLEQWHLQIRVGLTGAFLCSQTFGGWMAKNGGGVILNIASDLSVIAPDQRIYRRDDLPDDRQPVKPVTYSVIKTGLIGLTKYLATYWANKGVRVNALSPGGVYVNQSDEFVGKLTTLIPIGRIARRDEYRAAVQFLCSDASSYLTGQNIVMDGGRSVW